MIFPQKPPGSHPHPMGVSPTGDIITLQSASASTTPSQFWYCHWRHRNRHRSKSPPDDTSSDPKSDSNVSTSFSLPSKPFNWELSFGSDDDPAASRLQQTLNENFGDGIPDLQNIINCEIFEDALYNIDSTYNVSLLPTTEDNSCKWCNHICIPGPSSNPTYDQHSDLSVPLVNKHKFWEYDTFLTNPTELRCFYQGIIDHCAHYDINAKEVSEALPIKP